MTSWNRRAVRSAAGALAVALLAACAAAPPPATRTAQGPPAHAAGGAPWTELLPTDPALVTGAAASGLRYVVKRHPNPAGRAAFWLHVAAGSLDEEEHTRGLAHYLEHMAFNGSAHFPPGALIPYFESIGLSFGRDQNAFTGLDQTVYQIAVPDTRAETVAKALLYLGDVATRLTLSPEEIDRERQIILEEKRARASADQRVGDHVIERLVPALGRRLPIGTEEAIKGVRPEHFRDFYARHYVPSNMTLLAVCDCEPSLVVDRIRQEFDGAPRAPRPPPRAVTVSETAGLRGIVATDRDLTRASVSLTRVERPRPPRTTLGQARRDIVETLGVRAFNRRLDARLAAGRASFLEAGGNVADWARAARLVSVRASGPPERWRAMLDEMAAAVQQARVHGFTTREIEIVRRALLAEAEEAVQRQPTQPARALLRQLNAGVAREEPLMSAEQRRALMQRLLAGIEAAEVSQAFAETFDFTNVVVVASLPAGAGVPDEETLASVGRSALLAQVEPPTDLADEARLLEAPPPPGRMLQRSEHAGSGVTSAWLDNGVRVHHRFVGQRRNEVRVRITLAGGEIEETAATRGLTRAAALAWQRPATATLTSTQVRELMTGRRVQVHATVEADSLTLVVTGDPAELEHGLQLVYRLLTDPLVEAATLAQWQESEVQAITARRSRPAGVLGEALADAIYPPAELRTRPLSAEQVRAITREAAQAWLARLVATAPIEVAVVGDLEHEQGLGLVTRYLASLPSRARIDRNTLGALRAIARPPGPIVSARSVTTATSQAVVLDGFFGADVTNVRDTRLLALAARVLSTRMNRIVREERQLVYSIRASSRPAAEYPGYGLFVAQAPTDPDKTAALAAALEELFTAFAKDGPSDDEIRVARAQIDNALAEALAGPDFWSDRLASLDYRGTRLDDVMEARERYAAMTAAEVQEAFARYYAPGARVRIIVTPR
jgi:zinc protease